MLFFTAEDGYLYTQFTMFTKQTTNYHIKNSGYFARIGIGMKRVTHDKTQNESCTIETHNLFLRRTKRADTQTNADNLCK